MIILHTSDVHFGRPHLPPVSDAIVRLAHEIRPDGVVVSGDLTQRAKVEEYRAAADFLARLGPYPVVATVGNHDVPLYRAWERLIAPYRNYRAHICQDLDTVTDLEGARIVALSSAAPRTAVVNGRLARSQLRFAEEAFATAPAGACRMLVVHHHLISPGDYEPDRPLHGATEAIRKVHEWRVDLVLSGHLHRSFVRVTTEGLPAGVAPLGVPLVHAGTGASSRGRGRERGRNSLNVIRVEQMGIEITVYLYSQDAERFLPAESHRYPRAFG